jgi:nitrogen regulatory protein P-II 2
MKLIVAYIKPEKLNSVKQALFDKEIFKISVTNALGCGEEPGFHETYRGVDIEVNLLKKVRIEIALNEEYVEKAVAAIVDGAHSDKVGDGKIFISALEDCVRIRTGERGKEAIG